MKPSPWLFSLRQDHIIHPATSVISSLEIPSVAAAKAQESDLCTCLLQTDAPQVQQSAASTSALEYVCTSQGTNIS